MREPQYPFIPLGHPLPSFEHYLESPTSQQAVMAPKFCALCAKSDVILKRPKIDLQRCSSYVFEAEVHDATT